MRSLILTLALVGSAASSAKAQTVDVARMDQVVQSYVPRQFMGNVLVARGADVVFTKSYGFANLEWNIANTANTKFRLGSLTKQFTAASIMLLEERGKLKVDDLIKQHVPDAPAAWDRITIFHLLTHTSGIPNFTAMPEYAAMEPFASPVEKTIATFRDKPLDFAPGEKMSYSNSGYLVLGHIIEKISGGSYATFVQDNLFTPVGMKDSGYDSNSAITPRRAAGYTPGPVGPANASFVHMSIPHAAGALYSTTEDLLRWEQALFGGRVVSAASLEKMTTAFKNFYGFGLGVRELKGRKQIAHSGGIQGFNTTLVYYPDERLTIAVLSNVAGPAADAIASKLDQLAHGDTIQLTSERKEIALPPAALASYVGTYQMAGGPEIAVTADGSQLFAQLTGQQKFPIFAETETLFFFKIVDATIEFEKGPAVSARLTLRQGGREAVAIRK